MRVLTQEERVYFPIWSNPGGGRAGAVQTALILEGWGGLASSQGLGTGREQEESPSPEWTQGS